VGDKGRWNRTQDLIIGGKINFVGLAIFWQRSGLTSLDVREAPIEINHHQAFVRLQRTQHEFMARKGILEPFGRDRHFAKDNADKAPEPNRPTT
jgi:hypothetical protein